MSVSFLLSFLRLTTHIYWVHTMCQELFKMLLNEPKFLFSWVIICGKGRQWRRMQISGGDFSEPLQVTAKLHKTCVLVRNSGRDLAVLLLQVFLDPAEDSNARGMWVGGGPHALPKSLSKSPKDVVHPQRKSPWEVKSCPAMLLAISPLIPALWIANCSPSACFGVWSGTRLASALAWFPPHLVPMVMSSSCRRSLGYFPSLFSLLLLTHHFLSSLAFFLRGW